MTGPLDVRIVSNLSPPDWWTIGLTGFATILGALIGAGVAYLVALKTASNQSEAEQLRRRELEELATMRVSVSLMQLVNSVTGYRNQIVKSLHEADEKLGLEQPLCFRMRGTSTSAEAIDVNTDDLIVFMKTRETAFVSRFLYALARYRALCGSLAFYSDEREKLLALLVPTRMDGLIGTILPDKEQEQRLRPKIASISDFGAQVLRDLEETNSLALSACREFGPLVKSYFNDPTFPVPGIPSDLASAGGA